MRSILVSGQKLEADLQGKLLDTERQEVESTGAGYAGKSIVLIAIRLRSLEDSCARSRLAMPREDLHRNMPAIASGSR